jgi:exodeoxyribonuclease VII small subunit
MPRKKTDAINFEKSLAELTNIVEKMEQGNLPLEQSLEQFEKGITLIRHCQQALSDAEQKVQVLTQQGKLAEFKDAE